MGKVAGPEEADIPQPFSVFPATKRNPAGWYNLSQRYFPHPTISARGARIGGLRPVGDGGSDDTMDIHQLTEAMNRFVRSKGWYDANSPRPQTPRNLAVSLVLESAEVLEHFQWDPQTSPSGEPERIPALEEELADVALYLLQLASVLGIDLEQATLKKLEKNYSRRWPASPKGDKAAG